MASKSIQAVNSFKELKEAGTSPNQSIKSTGKKEGLIKNVEDKIKNLLSDCINKKSSSTLPKDEFNLMNVKPKLTKNQAATVIQRNFKMSQAKEDYQIR